MKPIFTKKCLHCGIEFKTHKEKQTYCSHTCSNRGRRILEKGEFDHSLLWEKDSDKMWLCPYAENVSCHRRKCNTCGWNPKVAKARLDKIMGVV